MSLASDFERAVQILESEKDVNELVNFHKSVMSPAYKIAVEKAIGRVMNKTQDEVTLLLQ